MNLFLTNSTEGRAFKMCTRHLKKSIGYSTLHAMSYYLFKQVVMITIQGKCQGWNVFSAEAQSLKSTTIGQPVNLRGNTK